MLPHAPILVKVGWAGHQRHPGPCSPCWYLPRLMKKKGRGGVPLTGELGPLKATFLPLPHCPCPCLPTRLSA